MTTKQQTPEFLRLRAKIKRDDLPALCRKEGRTVTATLRAASHLVHDEDVKGEQPKQCSAAVELAKEIRRLERKASDPGYPETARKQYLENEANDENFLAEFPKRTNKAQAKEQEATDEPEE